MLLYATLHPVLPCCCRSVGRSVVSSVCRSVGRSVGRYLDPHTGTGPSKDALPRHRVMVFDPLPAGGV